MGGFPGVVGRRQADGAAAGFPDSDNRHEVDGIWVLEPGLVCFGHSEPAPCRVLRGVSRREWRGVGRVCRWQVVGEVRGRVAAPWRG